MLQAILPNKYGTSTVPAKSTISINKVDIVKYQLFQRTSFAYGLVASMSSLPSNIDFKEAARYEKSGARAGFGVIGVYDNSFNLSSNDWWVKWLNG